MQRSGDQLLTGATLTGDQHRRRDTRGLADCITNATRGSARAAEQPGADEPESDEQAAECGGLELSGFEVGPGDSDPDAHGAQEEQARRQGQQDREDEQV